ncbi:fungal-specific transcription factor domain-containing protein [Cercophora newfieldiana]|uniref:Fungal-specific transcription factor domain-containing protein n=1 Tax=Cercophora newfieldiana TaxID=92897 RepID=A0AA40CI48_9PEZI|nr:fungal-specific transcription factor domain-containing protein [Cercophora newfieldiana]
MFFALNTGGFAGTWTDATSDQQLVRHLLELYFCWEYPALASLSREHFIADFAAGRPRFCSSLLVNALLSLACRFSDRPESRNQDNQSHTAGDNFFDEAQRLFWAMDDHRGLTTIQALGIMSIRQASCGRDAESRYYAGQSVRLCIELGLHRCSPDVSQDDEQVVRLATFWGAFALDHAWSLTTGSLPQFSRFPRFPPKITTKPEIENALWVPYTDDGSLLHHPCEQPSHIISVFKSFCELSEIVHSAMYTLHCPAKAPDRDDMLNIYSMFLSWYDSLPAVFRLGGNFTPQVLFMHGYYHYAIILTFRPFLDLRLKNSNILPRSVCIQAADAIHGHMRSYSQLYSLRRTPWFMPYLVLMSSRLYLSVGGLYLSPDTSGSLSAGLRQALWSARGAEDISDTLNRVQQGLDNLGEMRPCHGAATIAWNMLRYLNDALEVYVEISRALEGGQWQGGEFDPRWVAFSEKRGLDFFPPSPGENQSEGYVQGSTDGMDRAGQEGRSIDGMLSLLQSSDALKSALYWPSPRRPPPLIILTGPALEKAGFKPLE